MSNAFGLGPIGQIAVNVRDLSRAVQFYSHTLGMTQQFADSQMAFFDAGGIRLLLYMPESPSPQPSTCVLYFKVAKIRHAFQVLVERGVHFTAGPHCIAEVSTGELWMAFFRDSEGNLMALMSENETAGASKN